MAQPKKAQFQDDPKDHDEFPEEFTHDEAESTLSDDIIETISLDGIDERDQQEYRKLNPPAGEWLKEEEWQFKKFTNRQDSLPGDLDPQGRTLLTFIGVPRARVVDGQDYDPVLLLRISPDIRYKQDEPDKVDRAYTLWLQAKEMYLALKGARPKMIGDIIKMLQYDEYTVRTMKGDSGPIILDVRAKREGRGQRRNS